MSSTTTPTKPYTASPVDACEEAAQRINVVIKMLGHHDCKEDDRADDTTGGYDLSILGEALEGIRNMLQASARAASESGGAQ